MTNLAIPRPSERRHVAVSATDPHDRGRLRGEMIRKELPAGIEAYDRLFAAAGIAQQTVRSESERALGDIDGFSPRARVEIEGIAEGSGVPAWRIAALNARTEILARSTTVPPGECSTIVRRPEGAGGRATGVQTWDWHVEMSLTWHTVESRGGKHDFVGITEHGILGKIGVNSAGIALHFNILGHVDDGTGGVPMHVLAAVVLEQAGSVAEAVELVRTAPIGSSGSFALFDASSDAVLLDISPVGVFELRPEGGALLRTNHFLSEAPRAGEKNWAYQPDSGHRYALLAERLGAAELPATAEELLPRMVTGPDEAPVTCLPDTDAPLGMRWASLATVILDPGQRSAKVLDGTPADAVTGSWRTLIA